VTDTIEALNKNNFITWIASGDSLGRVLPAAYLAKILPENN